MSEVGYICQDPRRDRSQISSPGSSWEFLTSVGKFPEDPESLGSF